MKHHHAKKQKHRKGKSPKKSNKNLKTKEKELIYKSILKRLRNTAIKGLVIKKLKEPFLVNINMENFTDSPKDEMDAAAEESPGWEDDD